MTKPVKQEILTQKEQELKAVLLENSLDFIDVKIIPNINFSNTSSTRNHYNKVKFAGEKFARNLKKSSDNKCRNKSKDCIPFFKHDIHLGGEINEKNIVFLPEDLAIFLKKVLEDYSSESYTPIIKIKDMFIYGDFSYLRNKEEILFFENIFKNDELSLLLQSKINPKSIEAMKTKGIAPRDWSIIKLDYQKGYNHENMILIPTKDRDFIIRRLANASPSLLNNYRNKKVIFDIYQPSKTQTKGFIRKLFKNPHSIRMLQDVINEDELADIKENGIIPDKFAVIAIDIEKKYVPDNMLLVKRRSITRVREMIRNEDPEIIKAIKSQKLYIETPELVDLTPHEYMLSLKATLNPDKLEAMGIPKEYIDKIKFKNFFDLSIKNNRNKPLHDINKERYKSPQSRLKYASKHESNWEYLTEDEASNLLDYMKNDKRFIREIEIVSPPKLKISKSMKKLIDTGNDHLIKWPDENPIFEDAYKYSDKKKVREDYEKMMPFFVNHCATSKYEHAKLKNMGFSDCDIDIMKLGYRPSLTYSIGTTRKGKEILRETNLSIHHIIPISFGVTFKEHFPNEPDKAPVYFMINPNSKKNLCMMDRWLHFLIHKDFIDAQGRAKPGSKIKIIDPSALGNILDHMSLIKEYGITFNKKTSNNNNKENHIFWAIENRSQRQKD